MSRDSPSGRQAGNRLPVQVNRLMWLCLLTRLSIYIRWPLSHTDSDTAYVSVKAAEAALQATHQPDPLPATSCHGMCRTSTEQGAVRAKQWVQQASGPQPAPVEAAEAAALQATHPLDPMPAASCHGMCRASTEPVRTGSRESEAVGATSKRTPASARRGRQGSSTAGDAST
jgi:hypothetical protein